MKPVPPLSTAPVRLPDGRRLPCQLDIVRELGRRGVPGLTLAEFAVAAWHVVEPATPLVWSWHLDVLCNELQGQLEGGRFGRPWYQNLIVNVPPGTMKSLIVNVFALPWKWLWDPAWSAICASANPDGVGLRDAVKCREILESAWYRETFAPTWQLAEDQNAKSNYKNTASGFRRTQGTKTGVTGARAAAILIDDPLDVSDAPSQVARDSVNYTLAKGFSNRLNDMQTGTRTLIMQRLHEDDPTAHLLERWKPTRHICLPTEFEAAHPHRFEGDPRTVEGELLFAERFPPSVLEHERLALGPMGYAGQHQQRPAPMEGNMFKRADWRFWSYLPEVRARPEGATTDPPRVLEVGREDFEEEIQSWDCAFKKAEGNDLVCGLVVAKKGGNYFVLAADWRHMNFVETRDAVKSLRARFPRTFWIGIEDKANGTAVIETLKEELDGVTAVEPEGGKEARAASITPAVAAGNVYLPEGADWLPAWFDEFGSFPRGKHDDAVDALSQGLRYFRQDGEEQHTRLLLGM